MKILFVTFGPELIPSSRTRVYQYLPFFEKDNIIYKVVNNFNSIPYLLTNYFNSSQVNIKCGVISKIIHLFFFTLISIGHLFNIIYSLFQNIRVTLLIVFGKYNVLFIQKVFFPVFLIKIYKYYIKLIIFDFDDAIYIQKGLFRNQKQFNRLVPFYDLIVLENTDSDQYVKGLGHINTLLITGPIDTARYYPIHNNVNNNKIIIGWIGSPSTQSYIYLISEVLQRLCNKYNNVILETIGAGNLNIDNIQISKKDWNLETEVNNLRNFDIGIMPLTDDDWAKGKGGYKLLQYMAMGIPCCASPVGINKQLIVEGSTGFLVNGQEDWFDKLSYLIENKSIRDKMGMNGRKRVKEFYSLEVAANKFTDIIKSINK